MDVVDPLILRFGKVVDTSPPKADDPPRRQDVIMHSFSSLTDKDAVGLKKLNIGPKLKKPEAKIAGRRLPEKIYELLVESDRLSSHEDTKKWLVRGYGTSNPESLNVDEIPFLARDLNSHVLFLLQKEQKEIIAQMAATRAGAQAKVAQRRI
jgi:hypothetical protein